MGRTAKHRQTDPEPSDELSAQAQVDKTAFLLFTSLCSAMIILVLVSLILVVTTLNMPG